MSRKNPGDAVFEPSTDEQAERAADEAVAQRLAAAQAIAASFGDRSKTVVDGVLVYSATGEPVFPGATGVAR